MSAGKARFVLMKRLSRALAVPKVLQRGPPLLAPRSTTCADKLGLGLAAWVAAVVLVWASAAASLAAVAVALSAQEAACGGEGPASGSGVAGLAVW